MKNTITTIALSTIVATSAFASESYLGYTTGTVDRTITVASVKAGSGVIIDQVFYQVGFGAGQVDPSLASAAYTASIAVK